MMSQGATAHCLLSRIELGFMQVKSNDRSLIAQQDAENKPHSITAVVNQVERYDCPRRRSSLTYRKIDGETVILASVQSSIT